MSKPLFVDVHILQSVPPSNINRDDTGSPKTARFGGVTRARVSSQAWKKAARDLFPAYLETDDLGIRSLHIVNKLSDYIRSKDDSITFDSAIALAREVVESAGIKIDDKNETKYSTFVSRKQFSSLADLAIKLPSLNLQIKELEDALNSEQKKEGVSKVKIRDIRRRIKDLEAEVKSAPTILADATLQSIDIAMFGRMVTDNSELNIDAAVQVAHAIGVSKMSPEFDYFTMMDEVEKRVRMIETTEFTSSTLYRYANIDVLHLCENLGSATVACKGIEAFLRAFVLSMPTGKQNSFANRTLPVVTVVELRETQPVSLVNAFEKPVVATAEKSQIERACEELVTQESALDKAFGIAPKETLIVIASPGANVLKEFPNTSVTDLDNLISRVSEACATYLEESGYPSESRE